MKKRILLTGLILFTLLPLKADEGMWLLPLLKEMNSGRMTELGFEITPDEIYNLNHSSTKDAIVIFGRGCTGEIVSKNGLLFTNHHCGYSNIQALSSVEHNYLKDGYWAMNLNEELPAKGLEVRFLESFTDVTSKVEKALSGSKSQEQKNKAYNTLYEKLCKKAGCDGKFIEGALTSFYGGNKYYFIVYKVYKDVRFVGAPPSSIGKFGADTDNWMWPRHTGDFSVFRVYAGKDNQPAEYSEENVPYSAEEGNYLKISLKGYQPEDPVMVMGYPGRTNRFATSYELDYQVSLNERVIEIRTERQKVLMEDMRRDPAIMIQYASKYASSSNGWKKYIGMNETLDRLNVPSRRAAQEKDFTEWVQQGNKKRKDKYSLALDKISRSIENKRDIEIYLTTLRESLANIELFAISSIAMNPLNYDSLSKYMGNVENFYKDFSCETDKKVAVKMIELFRKFYGSSELLPSLYNVIDSCYGSDINAYVEDIYSRSIFTSLEKLSQACKEASANNTIITSDPATQAYTTISNAWQAGRNILSQAQTGNDFSEGVKDYIAGTLEMRKGEPIYPDANFTLRLTFGQVLPYSPRDGVIYDYYTTLDGVMAKEDPNNWEFEVPEKLKQLYNDKDFGEYALPNGKLPVAFISNLDITGGNSGSPIMNGKGELIGLAFDGNWDAMSGDILFEPNYQRCISIDVRYLLFIMDKFGGAGYLLDEMNIVR